jgi:hypothetical protein
MAAKKTFNIDAFKATVNESLRVSGTDPETAGRRQGMMNALEHVLYTSGNYRGFRYLLAAEVPKGAKPGVIYEGMVPHPDIVKRFEGTDNTRVEYY